MTSSTRARAAAGMTDEPAAEPSRELSPLDQRIALTRGMELAFADAVASGLRPETLVRDAITALRNVPELHQTDQASFFGALMTAAQLGLRPNVAPLGHGWVLPFYNKKEGRKEATWILGYQGMIELGYKSGFVTKITAHTIYANERYAIEYGTADSLTHSPMLDRETRGEMVAHYAVVTLTSGDKLWNVISEADARDIMARSQTGANGRGPWVSDYVQMARKTALRGLWRYMPKTPILALALSTDDVVRTDIGKDPTVAAPDETVQEEVVDAEVVANSDDVCTVCGRTDGKHDDDAHAAAGV